MTSWDPFQPEFPVHSMGRKFPFICDGKLTINKNESQILGEMHWQDEISKDQGSLEVKL